MIKSQKIIFKYYWSIQYFAKSTEKYKYFIWQLEISPKSFRCSRINLTPLGIKTVFVERISISPAKKFMNDNIKKCILKLNTKPFLSIGNNWFYLRNVSLTLRNTHLVCVGVNLSVPNGFGMFVTSFSEIRKKKSISTAYYIRLWIFFLVSRFMRSEWNKSTGWTERM